MPTHNADVAAIFEEIADLLEIQGANPFRIRAYRNAARTIGDQVQDLARQAQSGQAFTELPGIGEDLAAKIAEILDSGKCAFLERLRREVSPALAQLLRVPGLGPKRVKLLHDSLNVRNLEELRQAAAAGRIRELRGFGAKSEERIRQALAARAAAPKRYKLASAGQYAEALADYLGADKAVEQVEIAGSFRRMRDTVGDLDLLVAARSAEEVMRRFAAYDEVQEMLAQGETRASAVLKSGIQVDIRVVPRVSFGAALQYFTGSKAHNIALRRLGQERGLKINEYGVFRGRQRVAGDTEESVYRSVGLPWIAPELREDRGEIEAARTGALPRLIELSDLRGDLHAHTKATDGRNTLAEMAQAARDLGYAYLAITEHSRRLSVAHGLDPQRLARQIDDIDKFNQQSNAITILKGIEVDILEDGTLDLPDSILARLDLVVGAVHSKFELSRRKQTERILRALDNRYFSILAHPTGRLIDERPAYDIDMPRIIRQAKQRVCFLEVNAHPERLDLLDVHCQMARAEGVLIAVSSDAHSVWDFAHVRYGIGQARRGWLTKADVINTRPLGELRRMLKATMNR